MPKIMGKELHKDIIKNLTEKTFLKKADFTIKGMLALLEMDQWKRDIEGFVAEKNYSVERISELIEPIMEQIEPEPEEGWATYSYNKALGWLFPETEGIGFKEQRDKGSLMFNELLRTIWKFERNHRKFSRAVDMELLTEEECAGYQTEAEYKQFLKLDKSHYIQEFLRIGAEITPFNTLGHIAGVHFVAMYVAKQLKKKEVPVDLALVSASAAMHDIGKFGCKKEEGARIPYLHYYYTDECLKRLEMPMVAHIASNHSTWDLELENLSVESLLLIYADFRVKSTREADGKERINYYTLKEAFNIILNKLDNVDKAKEIRYTKVYEKLHDFEEYMKSIGVTVNLDAGKMREVSYKDSSLLNSSETIQRLKYMAIDHNIRVMNKFSNEIDFGNLLEDARSEKQWKNIRAYISTLAEYFTYMTLKQKQMTISFLVELLVHREGDIRRQAAGLTGEIIACYDEEYRKELPEGVNNNSKAVNSHFIWKEYLKYIIYPDLKTTEKQKRWMGYSLKITLTRLLENAEDDDKGIFLNSFLEMLETKKLNDAAVFIMLDTLLEIPLEQCSRWDINRIIDFCGKAMNKKELEIKVAVLRVIKYLATECGPDQLEDEATDNLHIILKKKVEKDKSVSVIYLKVKAREALGLRGQTTGKYKDELNVLEEDTSGIFRDNLKVGTPWTIKAVNIELMLDELRNGKKSEVFFIATHLSNLLKVSERVTVRHSAGRGLIELFKLLTWDQRNEIVIELTKGLEIGEYQFSKYIPDYLGVLIMMLHPDELDEIMYELQHLLESSNDKVAIVTLDTLAIMLKQYPRYSDTFIETEEEHYARKEKIIGMLLRGMASYHEVVSQEAFTELGQNIFGSSTMSLETKYDVFKRLYKKMVTLVEENKEAPLSFFNNAAALNHIYRFISDYQFYIGKLKLEDTDKVAFFPGTFDPFSLGHKGIVGTIRDLGFEVYLALDEFSWSKKTQARLYRKKIMTMSCADETGVYVFPDDQPINIANSQDIRKLKNIFGNKQVYIVVGSDVIANASSYKQEPEEDSIHSLNHIVFRRESEEQGFGADKNYKEAAARIQGEVVELTLPTHLEDISSTRIRENIDNNRDIASLIDPIVQSYIYDNALYLREPQYKHIMSAKDLRFKKGKKKGILENVSISDGSINNRLIASSRVHQVDTAHLYEEFKDQDLTGFIREKALGKILIIKDITVNQDATDDDAYQLILTETLAEALKEDFTYAVYHPEFPCEDGKHFVSVLERQGFREIVIKGSRTGCYGVDMRNPVTIFQNMDTVLKDPFNKNEKVEAALNKAHIRLQNSLTKLYPGSLVLSFNSAVMHHKLIRKITNENGVPSEPRKKRKLGPYMCVPFGKILNGMAVPNTVTKTLHMEKSFKPDLSGFEIKEYPFYSTIDNQVKNIKSFNRPVILVDDILHKGYRMRSLDSLLNENNVDVKKLMVGLLSGRGKDLITVQGREVDSVYFVPNLKAWFVESSQYPFIGGDGVERHTGTIDDAFTSINLIMPYVSPAFLRDVENSAIYEFSLVCLENARDIMLAIEEEYQNIFQRKLTLQRLSEAVISPKLVDVGQCLDFDRSIAASAYIQSDIEQLIRLKGLV